MKTKLVYVLTCSPDDHYIEQAFMAVYSARHWNPDAYIVLFVDDLTDKLLKGKRAGILAYISEKIVIPFEDLSLSMTYRSRIIKTSIREHIEGDFLFIDCDTITQRSLEGIDCLDCEVGAVPESHLRVADFCDSLFQVHQKRLSTFDLDLKGEDLYFSSGVILSRDCPDSFDLYNAWSSNWKMGLEKGLWADQPALAKANHDAGHIIKEIPGTYNCILFTQPTFAEDSHILHISSYKNPSLLFVNKTFSFIQENGIKNDWLIESILKPCSSFLPFDYQIIHSDLSDRIRWIKDNVVFLKGYGKFIDPSYEDFHMASRYQGIIKWLLRRRLTSLAVSLWMLWKRIHLRSKKNVLKDNICHK